MSYLNNLLDVNRNGFIDQNDLNTVNTFGGYRGLDVNHNGRVDFQDVHSLSAYSSGGYGSYGNGYGQGYAPYGNGYGQGYASYGNSYGRRYY